MRTLNTVMDTKSKSLIYQSTDSSINTLQAPFTFNPEWIINSLWSSHWVWKYPYSISSCIIFAVNSRWSGIVNLINNKKKKIDPHEWDMEIQTQKGGMYKLVIEAAINCTNAAIWIQWIGERWLIIFDARHLQYRSCALDSAASGCCSVLDQFKKSTPFASFITHLRENVVPMGPTRLLGPITISFLLGSFISFIWNYWLRVHSEERDEDLWFLFQVISLEKAVDSAGIGSVYESIGRGMIPQHRSLLSNGLLLSATN